MPGFAKETNADLSGARQSFRVGMACASALNAVRKTFFPICRFRCGRCGEEARDTKFFPEWSAEEVPSADRLPRLKCTNPLCPSWDEGDGLTVISEIPVQLD